MTDHSVQTGQTSIDRSRSMGLKLILVGALVVLLGAPLALVNLLAWERANRAETVSAEVGAAYGGAQDLYGVTPDICTLGKIIGGGFPLAAIAGRADIMLAGGTDTPISYGILKAWEALRVLARENCRPFSADRDGPHRAQL